MGVSVNTEKAWPMDQVPKGATLLLPWSTVSPGTLMPRIVTWFVTQTGARGSEQPEPHK